MARHGAAGAFTGFSVCQPALGAALQWLPAIGTPELDEMINALLPGPASIQDKRAHISMDFFEYSRQTGETFKFYPVPRGNFTPATASPATSTLYDSGYASSINRSPALSEQGSWTQSPAPLTPAVFDTKTKPRSSGSKKPSGSSSRQQTIDFANHPGMRILTRDGRDVTNSASRGCKTKEQREHAHLMRIIKACDLCKRKKVRCDPSHRKRSASQAAAVQQPEQKPAKRAKKAEEGPSRGVASDAPIDLTAAEPLTTQNPPFPAVDLGFPLESGDFWNEFVTLDQEPGVAAPAPVLDDFIFDSFADFPSFLSPSSGSSATSPSQVLTPVTPERAVASPVVASDRVIELSGAGSPQDPAVPYLNPGVALGTHYVDFNLYSPGPDVYDEDPVLQMRDLGSRQHSPQSTAHAADNVLDHNTPSTSATHVDVSTPPQAFASQPYGAAGQATVSPLDLSLDHDPGDTPYHDPQPSSTRQASANRKTMTNHNRLLQEPVADHGRYRRADAHESGVDAALAAQSPVARASSPAVPGSYASAVVANAPRWSVSPSKERRSRIIDVSSPSGGSYPAVRSCAPAGISQSDVSVSGASPRPSAPVAARRAGSPQCSSATVSSTAGASSRQKSPGVALRSAMPSDLCCSASSRRPAGRKPGSSAVRGGQHVVQQQAAVAVNTARATVLLSTLPTRRSVAGKNAAVSTSFFQLAVLGLVSFLCACALQAHLASQTSLVNMLAITTVSLARLAPRCFGLPGAARAAPITLPPPAQPGIAGNLLSLVQPVVSGSSKVQQSALSRWARRILPRTRLVRALRA
ncbi:hypothetical protein VTH06DRAFT_5000 [Thermothelomyces fergusii]